MHTNTYTSIYTDTHVHKHTCMRAHTYKHKYIHTYLGAKSFQSCPTLCNPMDYSLPDSSVHEILQTRILEWIAMPSSRGSSWPRDQTHIYYVFCISGHVLSHWHHPGSQIYTPACTQIMHTKHKPAYKHLHTYQHTYKTLTYKHMHAYMQIHTCMCLYTCSPTGVKITDAP